jgi:hypothetical protein
MDHFGLKSVKDLPKLKDIQPEENQIGAPTDLIELLESDDAEPQTALAEGQDQSEDQIEEAVKIQPEIVDEVLEQTENQSKESASAEEDHHTAEVSEEITDTHSQ